MKYEVEKVIIYREVYKTIVEADSYDEAEQEANNVSFDNWKFDGDMDTVEEITDVQYIEELNTND